MLRSHVTFFRWGSPLLCGVVFESNIQDSCVSRELCESRNCLSPLQSEMPGGISRWSIVVQDKKAYVFTNGKPLSRKNMQFVNFKHAEPTEYRGKVAIKVSFELFYLVCFSAALV